MSYLIEFNWIQFKEIHKTALIKSIEVNNCDFVQFLISRKNFYLSKYGINPLLYVIQQRNPEIVRLLLTFKDINANIKSPNNFKKHITKDIGDGSTFSLECEGSTIRTPLYYAIEKNNSDIVNLLMTRKEVDTNFMCNCKYHEFPYMRHTNYEYTKSVLFIAFENNNVEIVRS